MDKTQKKVKLITINDFEYIKNSLPIDLSKDFLRKLRETECFSIINRGGLWYELLSDYQKYELKEWYQKWLNVTETFICPIRPMWLR